MAGRRALFLDWGGTLALAREQRTVEGNPVFMPNVESTLARVGPGFERCFIVSDQARVGKDEITEAEVVRRFAWAKDFFGEER